MLVEMQQRLLPELSRLQVPFTVVHNNKDILDFVAVDLDETNCLRVVEEAQSSLAMLLKILKPTA